MISDTSQCFLFLWNSIYPSGLQMTRSWIIKILSSNTIGGQYVPIIERYWRYEARSPTHLCICVLPTESVSIVFMFTFYLLALSFASYVIILNGFKLSSIPVEAMTRFIDSQDALHLELSAWKESAAGQYAIHQGWIGQSEDPSDATNTLKEQIRRFFLSKLLIEDAQRLNPDAEFSTDSPFTLMTNEEFKKFVGVSFQFHSATTSDFTVVEANHTNPSVTTDAFVVLDDKDWTTSGCVARVKDQGHCGSCWAFAAVASLESAYCLKGNNLTTFSEQQVTSCDTSSSGCQGGFPGDALEFIKSLGGICRENDFPYTSGDSGETGTCPNQLCQVVKVEIKGVGKVDESDQGLLEAVSRQPVAVGVAAGNDTWKQYKSGVVSHCASSELDHAVLVVGYGGSDGRAPYYTVKNSWGTTWGESGFIRLKRGGAGAGTCGIIGPKSVYPVL